ncbi:aspartate/glutamate racemase family protein [Jannaschia sp. S6380]|uniref:aspartate/glutamate racemase family protein n=1 Tax=Jannaschia sp. S6380 TaxID=2926408 RepID=UPI001FF5A027|nr:aspartate/glutamate racemase family protein [Jannaschia sp. S6380]MCK0169032.1 aspartate/glutamate racemase family protein [Jannaschia sp. S6380]
MEQAGGKTVFGASVGILMLNTRFPRIPGDIGNATTWPFPVQYNRVDAATPQNVVRGEATDLLGPFVDAGRELVALGCDGIATNCGFLAPFQTEMAAALGVPVAASSLLQAGLVQQTLPADRRLGILTISAETLGAAHLAAAGIPAGTPVVGTGAGSHFTEAILSDAARIDFAQARADNVAAARRLVADHPDVGAILLECTNMVPYAADIRAATGRPVFSIYTHLLWFQAALAPRRFGDRIDDTRLPDGQAP